MASGMELMLKGFGLDPEKIKKDVANFGQIIADIHTRLIRIEEKQSEILEAINGVTATAKSALPHDAGLGDIAKHS